MPGGDSPIVLDAVLRAAEAARIGIAISLLGPSSSRCIYATETAASLLGTTIDRLVGGSVRDFLDPTELPALMEAARALMEDPGKSGVVEVTAVHPDGRRRAIELAHASTTYAGQPAVIAFLINVGEQREAARKVRETAERLAQIVERTPDAIVITRDGLVLEANPAAARMLGLGQPDQLLGRSIADFLSEDDAKIMHDRVSRIARAEDPGAPRIYPARGEDGVTRLIEIASFALAYQGQPANIAFGRDVSERERLHEHLARVQRLAALGTLATSVAHEINNPLAALSLGTALVSRIASRAAMTDDDRAQLEVALADVNASIERMTATVRELTGFSRISTERLEVVDLEAVVESALRVARHATRHRAKTTVSLGERARVQGNAAKLEQVIVNLVTNAADALPLDRPPEDNEISIRAYRTDAHVVLEVRDNGVGIAPDVLPRVFDPFFTTKPAGAGTGLGLFICHNLIQQMGGEVTVESSSGRGACFRVALHPGAGEPELAPPRSGSADGDIAGLRVLIIDDEAAIRRSLARWLGEHHEVTVAASGGEAIGILSATAHFDVILCDLAMPGITGREVYERVVQTNPRLARSIVFMTGGAYTPELRAFLADVAPLCLSKPLDLHELSDVVARVGRGELAP